LGEIQGGLIIAYLRLLDSYLDAFSFASSWALAAEARLPNKTMAQNRLLQINIIETPSLKIPA
jgi:hypothetical protein